jgi:hypothetical protein
MTSGWSARTRAVAAAVASASIALALCTGEQAFASTPHHESVHLAAGGCRDGDRAAAKSTAARGAFTDPVNKVEWTDQFGGWDAVYFAELRFDPDTGCAWALGGWASLAQVWLERSSNPGEKLGARYAGSSTTYTGVFDGRGQSVRACTQGSQTAHCTDWYSVPA